MRAARPHGRLRAFVEPCGRAGCPPLWSLVAVRAARPHGRLRAFVELVAVRAARPHGRLRAFVEPCGRAGCPPAWALEPCGRAGCPPAWALEPCGRAGCPPAWATQSLCGALWPCDLPARMGDSEPLWSLVAVRAGRPHGRLRAFVEPCGREDCPPAWATQSLCGALWPCGLPARMGDSEPLWSLVAVQAARPHGRLRAFVSLVAVRAARPHGRLRALVEALWPCGLPARMGDSEPLWSLVAVRPARPHGRLRAFVEALWPCGLPARMGDSEPLWSLVAVRAARPHG